jgi:N-acetyl-anhydromuramyl-L-alanine amidase AmpD
LKKDSGSDFDWNSVYDKKQKKPTLDKQKKEEKPRKKSKKSSKDTKKDEKD